MGRAAWSRYSPATCRICIPLAALDGIRYGWEDEEVDRDAIMERYNPGEGDSRYDFEAMSMALQDGKLAIAWNDPGFTMD